METLLELRVSRVGPAVENNLVQLVDMVKTMGRKNGNLTESQNRKMVSYLGNLDEMRSQLVIMIQRYENDSHVLKRLLGLVDRIDDVKNLALTSEESKGEEGELITDQEIAEKYDTPFNPLMVSTLNILDVSGLFASKILGIVEEEEEEGEEEAGEESEEDGDAYWDHEDDPALLAEETGPQEVQAINLSMSNMCLPGLFESCDNLPTTPPPPRTASAILHSSASNAPSPTLSPLTPALSVEKIGGMKERVKKDTVRNDLSVSDANLPSLFDSRVNVPTIPVPPPFPAKKDIKGKGKAKRQLGIDTRKKDGKGKGKAKAVTFQVSSSESEMSGTGSETGSESESEEESEGEGEGPNGANVEQPAKPTLAWKRSTVPGRNGASSSSSSSSSSSTTANLLPLPVRQTKTDSGSESDYTPTESESESETESVNSSSSSEVESRREIRARRKQARGVSGASSSSSSAATSTKQKRKRGPCDPPVLCKICYEEYDKWEKVHQFSGCDHTYCRECLRDYLATNINEGAVLDLTCPFPDCKTEFPPKDIKFLCTSDVYAKYERFTLLAALRADPNARWCPNPYCNNGIKHTPETMPWVFCGACKFEFCFHCMAERHDGAACGKEALEYLKKKHEMELEADKQFKEFTDLMKSFVKPCPGCKAFIEKNDGCNHMTCTNPACRAQFCWLCLNIYTSDHFVDDINFPDCYDKQYWTPPEILLQSATIARHAAVVPRSRRFANIAKKVGIYMGVGVAVVTLGVPAAVIGGPVYGCFKLHKRLKARRRARRAGGGVGVGGGGADFVPPTPERIAEARREAARLYALEHS